MKKLLLILATVSLLALGLAACTGKSPAGETEPPNEGVTSGNEGISSGQLTSGDEGDNSEDAKMQINLTIGETRLTAALVENSATTALKEKLETAPITIDMSDYGGWEKVGGFGFSLPTSDEKITTDPCDFVLYQGNQLVIFYGSNRWDYTPLGKITNVTPEELKTILGKGDVTVTLSL